MRLFTMIYIEIYYYKYQNSNNTKYYMRQLVGIKGRCERMWKRMASVKETVETSLKTDQLRLQKNAMELISKHNYGYLQRFVFEEAT